MPKLKIDAVPDDRPVKLALELPAQIHRDLALYADLLARQTGEQVEPVKLIPQMIARFIAADRGFAQLRRGSVGRPRRKSQEGAPSV